jgi:long-subunit acyl-CoA synthetase (AMP-forming)
MNGKLMDGVEVKLISKPNLGYTTEDTPFPRGELLVKSGTVTPGYYLNEVIIHLMLYIFYRY